MSHQVDLRTAPTRLAELVAAAVRGEEVILTEDDRPVAKLVAVGPPTKRRRAGSAKGLITLAEDFDAPLEEFREYQE